MFPWVYCRGVAVKPTDPSTVFVAIGDSTPGRTGTVMQTTDTGATWKSISVGGLILDVHPWRFQYRVDVKKESLVVEDAKLRESP